MTATRTRAPRKGRKPATPGDPKPLQAAPGLPPDPEPDEMTQDTGPTEAEASQDPRPPAESAPDTSDPADSFGTPGSDTRETDTRTGDEPGTTPEPEGPGTAGPGDPQPETPATPKPAEAAKSYRVTLMVTTAGLGTEETSQRFQAAVIDGIQVREVTVKDAHRKGGTAGARIPASFPEGVIAPIAFRNLLISEGLVKGGLTPQMVYGYLKQKDFPVTHYAEDGAAHDEPVAVDGKTVTRPGVRVDEARAWYLARTTAKDTKAA